MHIKAIDVKSGIFISVLILTNLFLVYLWQSGNITLSTFLVLLISSFVLSFLNVYENFRMLEKRKAKLLEEGNSYLINGKSSAAESVFRKVLEMDKNSHDALIGVGNALKERAQWKKAGEYFSKAQKLKSTSYASFNAGLCYFKEGDYKNALCEFKSSLEQDKQISEAYLYLGDINFMLGEDFDAKKYYVKYLLASPAEENITCPTRKKLDTVVERIRQRKDNTVVKV
jgi:Tfp pilus assembly protein PilF